MPSRAQASKAGETKRRTRAARKPKAGKPRRHAGTPPKTSQDPQTDFSQDEWRDMVATTAYFLAESRGFDGGSVDEDWYEAEALLREQLGRAEDEADEKTASGLDLAAHDSEDETKT